MAQKNRSELRDLFKTGDKPSQQDFADFIESTLNIKDDGIERLSETDTTLKITAQGDDEKLLDFYAGQAKTWSINQKSGDKVGLNISTSDESSKLFIDSGSGNVGIGTTTPGAKLEVNGDLKVTGKITGEIDTGNITSGTLDVARIPNFSADKINSGTIGGTLSVIDSKVGIGTTSPTGNLEIKGVNPILKIWGLSHEDYATIQLGETTLNKATPAKWGFDLTYDGNDNKFHIEGYHDGKSQGKHLTIERNSGNVGIGTTTPGAKLDVSGTIKGGGVLAGIWSAQPTSHVKTTSTSWHDVAETSVKIKLDRPAVIFCTYSISIQPTSNPRSDYVGIRLAVDNKGYKESGSHYHPRHDSSATVSLNGNLVLSKSKWNHTVKLQWKQYPAHSYSNGSTVWENNPLWNNDSIGGRTLVVMAFYI